MLISEFVTTTWQRRTKSHYINLGYEYTNIDDEFIVKVEHLTLGSGIRVDVRCDGDFCNHKIINITYNNYNIKLRDGELYYCNKCAVKHFGIRKMAKTRISRTETFYDWCMSNNYKHILDRWDYELNDCNPNEVGAKTDRKYWFKCQNGIHESELKIINGLTKSKIENPYAIDCNACNSFGYYIEIKYGIKFLNKIWNYDLNNISPYNIDKYSNKKVWINCPDCGNVKPTALNNLSKRGIRCNICGDKISIPEKFGIYLFKQLGIDFKTQKVFDWSNKRKYDFYIPNLSIIIESHGDQHYRYTGRGRPLKEEQENDRLKYDLAIKNEMKSENYIVVDCRHSEFEWLKENYIKSLKNHFDLSSIDWDYVWENCQSSVIKKSWDIWNSMHNDKSIKEMINCLDINIKEVTFKKYLKIGFKLGKCNYKPTN